MLYYNTSSNIMRVYSGSAWENVAVSTSGFATLTGIETLTNKTLTSPKIGTSILDTNGNELFKVTATGSAVNEITYNNAATGNKPTFTASGDDTNIGVSIQPKGSGQVTIDNLTFPAADGSADQFLKTDGSGNLSFGDVSGGTSWQSSIKTSAFTAVAGEGYWVNTSGGAITVTFPSSASVGDTIEMSDYDRSWGTNNLTINRNGLNFQGGTENPVYDVNGQSVRIVYSGATKGWIPTSDDDVTNEGSLPPYTADFLVIAGGGAGGSGSAGGGGAGGYRNSYASETSGGGGSTESDITITSGAVYTITVGQGGTGDGPSSIAGADGNDSSISGTGVSITATGGGGGGAPNGDGSPGGSGGGAGRNRTSVPQAGAGTANQGYRGGVATGTPEGTCGGGGGSGEIGGTDGTGTGGDGLSSSITGSAVTRGGGGAGAKDYPTPSALAGGDGGGGNGGVGDVATNATDGSANTGGGGGGGRSTGAGNGGGDGGSGVVILRMATANYTGTTTGSPTVSTDGSDTILTFNASGSYTG